MFDRTVNPILVYLPFSHRRLEKGTRTSPVRLSWPDPAKGLTNNISEVDTSVIYFFLVEMELSTDELLESIGSFGRYQIMLNVFCNLAYMFWWGIPVMVMVFIASDPGWKCKNNATCPFTETIRLGDDNYSYRCDIPRKDWEFGNDFTSVVTQVNYIYKNRFSFKLCLLFSIPWELENYDFCFYLSLLRGVRMDK